MRIRTKLPLITSITVLITIVAITAYAIYDFRSKTKDSIELYRQEQRQFSENQLKDYVNNAYKMIEQAHELSLAAGESPLSAEGDISGQIIRSQFLRLTVENIRKIRFGDAGYIWINEVDPPYKIIMHPIFPKNEGKVVTTFKIPETKQNGYEAFADVIHENNGEGYLEYHYPKPGSPEDQPKLSFIKLFEPLGWVIGTGVYIDHIDKMVERKASQLNEQINQMVTFTIFFGLVLITLASIILYFFGKTITDAIYRVREQLYMMSKGLEVEKNEIERKDEIGDMDKSLNDLIDGVNSYAQFARNIGKGDLDSDFDMLSEEDNLGNSLLQMRDSLREARKEEELRQQENEKRNWANEGYTKFSELMRNSRENISDMAYDIIESLVSYTGSIQGGIFLYNEENPEDPHLKLAASTAYNRRKFKQKKINPGDGLVGACFLEKKRIYITKVPDDYIEIRSGLGTANPDSILIVPLMMEDKVIGIIELAAFKSFEDFEIEFVEKVSESIAASLYATRINVETTELRKNFEKYEQERESLKEQISRKDSQIRSLKRKLNALEDKKSILSF